jgi:hypothetical protein
VFQRRFTAASATLASATAFASLDRARAAELKPREALLKWLADVAAKRNTSR